MDNTLLSQKLLGFIQDSPSTYHVIQNFGHMLEDAGFTPLTEQSRWQLKPGGRYYVTRGGSALMAFILPEGDMDHFQIAAAHSDSPAFRIKFDPEICSGGYVRLNVEKYGGAVISPWLDRPLGVAGRLIVRTHEGTRTVPVDAGRDLCLIPNVAIHMNRKINAGFTYQIQNDLLPIYGEARDAGTFRYVMADAAGVDAADILDMDLYLYNRTPGSLWGADRQFISSGKLDDLQCAYSIITALCESSFAGISAENTLRMAAIFDNEEVGSRTRQGADSTFLTDTLARIAGKCGMDDEAFRMAVSKSFLISADNAHALHPAHMEMADPVNRPAMNKGPVIKYSANQKYTTDGVSAALFRELCARADVPCQTFVNHADMPGGSTLGNLSAGHLPVSSVDIGLAQLAMHSPYETAGAYDTGYLTDVLKTFYGSDIICTDSVSRIM